MRKFAQSGHTGQINLVCRSNLAFPTGAKNRQSFFEIFQNSAELGIETVDDDNADNDNMEEEREMCQNW